jgi:hypothetical protein
MKYYPCKNKTEFLTLLVMAENNGWQIDMQRFSAREYADHHWNGQNNFGIRGDLVASFSGIVHEDNTSWIKINFAEMAAILVNTAEPQITQKDLANYVCGWLFVNPADPNFSNLDLNNMKAALLNAANCLDCPNDGIAAYVERKKAHQSS